MDRHERNAKQIAEYLEGHAKVELYPGLPSHPQHDLAKRQRSGFGGVIGVDLTGDRRKELGMGDGFIRLSVGIEECDDLLADLERAFAAAG